ncbi:MAG: hypothetical protein LBF66_01855 [Holosporales bacterium]|jgi:hypothetical protein|nr:hypothetical protein [Holosporales bacterium]
MATGIHIPSDVPGFLRAQGIETSAFVPRSVSREPYRCHKMVKKVVDARF